MKLTNQITQAIENPQRVGSTVVLKWKSKPHNLVHFSATNLALDKHISGRLMVKGDVLVARIDKSSYNEKYARKKLRADLLKLSIIPEAVHFDTPFSLPLPEAQIGNTITTKERIDQMKPGDPDVTLAAGVRYYAVDNDVLDCGGDNLRRPFQARFIDQIERGCEDNPTALPHTLFLLIS